MIRITMKDHAKEHDETNAESETKVLLNVETAPDNNKNMENILSSDTLDVNYGFHFPFDPDIANKHKRVLHEMASM